MQRRVFSLNLIATLAGLGFLALLEAVLHLLDAGPSSRLFVKSRQSGEIVYTVNQRVGHRFFQHQYLRLVPSDASFHQKKPPNTVRILALGESTLIGFPNPVYTSFPNFLELMLSDCYPERRFEVLNCGMTAINTFCLLDFVEEVAEYDPDLIVLYTGHNEFIGPYGVTTPFIRFGNNRTLIRFHMQLQRSKLYYYLGELIYRLGEWWKPVSAAQEQFGPHLVHREINLREAGYQTTVENYSSNLAEMLRTARRHGVPVLLSTLVSNLKDFYPLRSACDGAEVSQRIEELVRQGRLQEAAQTCRRALAENPFCANLHFESGQVHYHLGGYQEARQELVLARDLDRLPFRAPTVFNQIIRKLANGDGVLLSDAEEVFATASPHGIVGNELITEYLHPTVYGHYLIALNMVEELAESAVGKCWGRGDTRGLKSYEEYTRQLGYSLVDQISRRNDLMLFLRRMPYKTPPEMVRRRVAALMLEQVRDIPRLDTAHRRDFVERGGIVFLSRMMDFLLLEDRKVLEERLESLDRGSRAR